MISHLKDNKDLIKDIIENAALFSQLHRIFTFSEKEKKYKILLSKKFIPIYIQKIIQDFKIIKYQNSWQNDNLRKINMICLMTDYLKVVDEGSFRNFVKEKFLEIIELNDFVLLSSDIEILIKILKVFKDEIEIDVYSLLQDISRWCSSYDDLWNFSSISELYPDDYYEFIEEDEGFSDTLRYVTEAEYENADNDLEEVLDNLESLEYYFDVNASYEIDEIKEKIAKKEIDEEINLDDEFDFPLEEKFYNKDMEIENIFETLLK